MRADNYGPIRGAPISRVHVRQSTQKPQAFLRTHPRLRLLLGNAYTIHIARSNDAPTRRFQRLSNCGVRPPLLVDRVRCGASVIEISNVDSRLGCISVITHFSVIASLLFLQGFDSFGSRVSNAKLFVKVVSYSSS